jgi:hypothetical protein
MKIAWIGGLDRNEEAFAEVARAAGHEIEFHTGRVGGRGTDNLRRTIERADYVVLVTAVNSHGAVDVARRAAKEFRRPLVLKHTCGLSRFRALCSELARAA